jgi:putative copper resistance protein D
MIVLAAAVRWLHLLALMLVFGASGFGWLRQRNAMGSLTPARLLFYASLVAAVTAGAQLLLTAEALSGSWTAVRDPANLGAVVRGTVFGHLLLLRSAALVGLIALASRPRPPAAAVTLLAAVGLAGVAATSHAAATGLESFALFRATTDALHLLAGGFWLGGLIALLCVVREKTSVQDSVALFSEVAIYAVTLLALAGALDAGFIFAAERVSWTYTMLLFAKVLLAISMIAIAFINRLRVTPLLTTEAGRTTLARNIRAELALGAIVVGIAAVLGSISPG